MEQEYSVYEILSCIGTAHNPKVGDLLMPQHVASKLGTSPEGAKAMLRQLEEEGYLEYDNGNSNGRIAGWHLTQKGLEVLL